MVLLQQVIIVFVFFLNQSFLAEIEIRKAELIFRERCESLRVVVVCTIYNTFCAKILLSDECLIHAI